MDKKIKTYEEITARIRKLKDLHLDCKEAGLENSIKAIENKIDALEWVINMRVD